MLRTLAAIGVFTSLLSAQNKGVINLQHVPPSMAYHRVWAVTPLIGSGKPGDPVRPLFVSTPSTLTQTPANRSGIIGYQMQLSDDGKSALVEYVFANPTAFQFVLQQEATARGVSVAANAVKSTLVPVQSVPAQGQPTLAAPSAAQTALEAAVPGLKMFERGKATETDVLTEFQKHKAGFAFGVGSVRPE
jgi:hypothetical protein